MHFFYLKMSREVKGLNVLLSVKKNLLRRHCWNSRSLFYFCYVWLLKWEVMRASCCGFNYSYKPNVVWERCTSINIWKRLLKLNKWSTLIFFFFCLLENRYQKSWFKSGSVWSLVTVFMILARQENWSCSKTRCLGLEWSTIYTGNVDFRSPGRPPLAIIYSHIIVSVSVTSGGTKDSVWQQFGNDCESPSIICLSRWKAQPKSEPQQKCSREGRMFPS